MLGSEVGAEERKTSGRWHMSIPLAQEMSPPLSLLESPRVLVELWERPGNCEVTAAAAEFNRASTASSHWRKPLAALSLSPFSTPPPSAPSKVAGPVTSPPNCCCRAASQIRSSREAGVGP